MKKILFSFALAVVTLTSQAQNMFNHLDLGVTLGTTGIGLDAAMPVGDWLRGHAPLQLRHELRGRVVRWDRNFDRPIYI